MVGLAGCCAPATGAKAPTPRSRVGSGANAEASLSRRRADKPASRTNLRCGGAHRFDPYQRAQPWHYQRGDLPHGSPALA
jgi:hypothetical protein